MIPFCQSCGIVSRSFTATNRSVNDFTITLPPNFKNSLGTPSSPTALPDFKPLRAFSIVFRLTFKENILLVLILLSSKSDKKELTLFTCVLSDIVESLPISPKCFIRHFSIFPFLSIRVVLSTGSMIWDGFILFLVSFNICQNPFAFCFGLIHWSVKVRILIALAFRLIAFCTALFR